MKQLVILRHAKSNRDYGVEDVDRPLSVNGINLILRVSRKKHVFFENTDVVISSPANRALHTATIVIRELNFPLNKLMVDKNLYSFSGSRVIDYIYELNDQWTKVVLVGHNPAFTEAVNHFSDRGISHLKTAGLAKIDFDSNQWIDINKGVLSLYQKNNNDLI